MMKTIVALKAFAIFLLLLNGTGAVFGGSQLMMHPDGSTMDLSLSLLRHSPFHNYFIPGIILFVANGLSSFFVIMMLGFNNKDYPLYVIAQGIILTIWILVQVFVINTIIPLHMLLGSVGILLIICGWGLKKLSYQAEQFRGQETAHSHS